MKIMECVNDSIMQSKVTDCLAIHNLPSTARTCHKFDEVHLPLVSVPKLCAHGCKVHFGPTTVHMTKNVQTVLLGKKDTTRNLYMVLLHDTVKECPRWHHTEPTMTAANAYDITRTAQPLAFLHASAVYPTRTFFLHVICCNCFLG